MPALVTASRQGHASSDASDKAKEKPLSWNAQASATVSGRQHQHQHQHPRHDAHAARNGESWDRPRASNGEWGATRLPHKLGEKNLRAQHVSGWEKAAPSDRKMAGAERSGAASFSRSPGVKDTTTLRREWSGTAQGMGDRRGFAGGESYEAFALDKAKDKRRRKESKSGSGRHWREEVTRRDSTAGHHTWCKEREGYAAYAQDRRYREGKGERPGRSINGITKKHTSRSPDRRFDDRYRSKVGRIY